LEVLKTRASNKGKTLNEFIADMATLVVIGLKRGNLRAKAFERTGDSGKKRYKELESTYQIKSESVGTAGFDKVTLPRVINANPLLTSKINKRYHLARVFDKGLGSKTLPACMQHTAFGALIPDGPVGDFIADAYILHGIELSMTVNPALVLEKAMTDQFNYLTIARNSSLYPKEDRVKYLKELEMDREYHNLFLITKSNKASQEQYNKFFSQ